MYPGLMQPSVTELGAASRMSGAILVRQCVRLRAQRSLSTAAFCRCRHQLAACRIGGVPWEPSALAGCSELSAELPLLPRTAPAALGVPT